MASIEVLYACTNCHQKFTLEELSSSQHLCKVCRKKFPSVECSYCQLDFYQLDKTGQGSCEQCTKDLKQHGKPTNCSICNVHAAFKGNTCSRCTHSVRKYGAPITCDHCKQCCAFNKPAESKKKVHGKTLCLLCTLKYKKSLFSKKGHSRDKLGPPPTKKSRVEGPPISDSMHDPLGNELLEQTEKLRSELNLVKKSSAMKDQQLIDKDKMICSLKAENLERDKDHRLKIQSLQKQHSEAVEELKSEIQSLKKQLSQSAKSSRSKQQ